METVGAQRILVHEPNPSTLVALVQTADMLPFPFLALAAGVLAVEGAGSALAIPAWQAVIPDLVPRRDLPAAAALGGIDQNVAQNVAHAIGLVLAGLMVWHFGAASVFALNALTFFFGIAVMLPVAAAGAARRHARPRATRRHGSDGRATATCELPLAFFQ
jgi:MFS family permease